MDDLEREVARLRADADEKKQRDAQRSATERAAIAQGDADALRLLEAFAQRMPRTLAVDFLTSKEIWRSAPGRRNLLGFRGPEQVWTEQKAIPAHSGWFLTAQESITWVTVQDSYSRGEERATGSLGLGVTLAGQPMQVFRYGNDVLVAGHPVADAAAHQRDARITPQDLARKTRLGGLPRPLSEWLSVEFDLLPDRATHHVMTPAASAPWTSRTPYRIPAQDIAEGLRPLLARVLAAAS